MGSVDADDSPSDSDAQSSDDESSDVAKDMISNAKDEVSECSEKDDDDDQGRSAGLENSEDDHPVENSSDVIEVDSKMTVCKHTCLDMSPESRSTDSDFHKSDELTIPDVDEINYTETSEHEKTPSVIKSTGASFSSISESAESFREKIHIPKTTENKRNPEKVTKSGTLECLSGKLKSENYVVSAYHSKRKLIPPDDGDQKYSLKNSIQSKTSHDFPLDLSVKKKPKINDKSSSSGGEVFSFSANNSPVRSSGNQSSSLKHLQKLFGGAVPFPYSQTKASLPISLKTPVLQKNKSEKFYQCSVNENKAEDKKSILRDLKVLAGPNTDLLSSLKYTMEATANNTVCETNDSDTKDKSDNKHTTLSCSCLKNFSSLYELSLHLQETGHAPGGSKPANLMDYPKLVRGQDMWLNQESEQTKRILRCMQCGESFRSLPMLTVHMMQTQHYAKIVSAEHGRRSHKCSSYCDSELEKECIFKCKVCDNMFTDMEGLANHMIMSGHHKKQVVRTQNIPDLSLRGKRKRTCSNSDTTTASNPTLSSQLDYKRKYFDFSQSLTSAHFFEKETKVLEGLIPCECCGNKIPMKYFADHVPVCLRQKSDVIYALKSKLKSESLTPRSFNKKLRNDSTELKRSDGKHLSRKTYSDFYYKHSTMYDTLLTDWRDSHQSLRSTNKNLNQRNSHNDSSVDLPIKKGEPEHEEKNKSDTNECEGTPNDVSQNSKDEEHLPSKEDLPNKSFKSNISEISTECNSETALADDSPASAVSELHENESVPGADGTENSPKIENDGIISGELKERENGEEEKTNEKCRKDEVVKCCPTENELDEDTGLTMPVINAISPSIEKTEVNISKLKDGHDQMKSENAGATKSNVDFEQTKNVKPELSCSAEKGVVYHWKRFEKYLQSLQDNIMPKTQNDAEDQSAEKSGESKDKEDVCKLDIINPDSETEEPGGSSALRAMESFIQKSFKSKFDFHGNRQSTSQNSISKPLPGTLSEIALKSRDTNSLKLINGHNSQNFMEKYLQHTESKMLDTSLNSANTSKLQINTYIKSSTDTCQTLSPVGSDKTDVTNCSSVDEGPITNKYLKMEEENGSKEKTGSALDSLSSFVYGQRMTSEHPLDSLQRLITKSHIPRVILGGDLKNHTGDRKCTPSVSPKLFAGFEESSNKPLNLSLKDRLYDSDDSLESESKELLSDEEDETSSQFDFEHMVYKCIACSRHFASKGSYRYHLSRCHLSTVKKYGIKEAFNLSPYVYLPLDHTAKFSKYYEMAQELASKRKHHHEEPLSS